MLLISFTSGFFKKKVSPGNEPTIINKANR